MPFFYYAREKIFPLHGESFSSPPGKKVPNGDVRKNCIPRPMTILFGMKKMEFRWGRTGLLDRENREKAFFAFLRPFFFVQCPPLFKSCGPQSWVSRPSRLDFHASALRFGASEIQKSRARIPKICCFWKQKGCFAKNRPSPNLQQRLIINTLHTFLCFLHFACKKMWDGKAL